MFGPVRRRRFLLYIAVFLCAAGRGLAGQALGFSAEAAAPGWDGPIRWSAALGFDARRLAAAFAVDGQPAGKAVDPARLRFSLRSPVFELGTFAGPARWSVLSPSLSGLGALLPARSPPRPDDPRRLPLHFDSLYGGDATRLLGVGAGLPDYLSAAYFRYLGGERSGWRAYGAAGALPLDLGSGETATRLRAGLAWYGAERDGGQAADPAAKAWWGGALWRPAAVGHAQFLTDAANQWLRAAALVQLSLPRQGRPAWSGGALADWRLFDGTGAVRLAGDLGFVKADAAYRTPFGEAAAGDWSLSGRVDCQSAGFWTFGVDFGAAAGYAPAPGPKPAYAPGETDWRWRAAWRDARRLVRFAWAEHGSRGADGTAARLSSWTADLAAEGQGALHGRGALGLRIDARDGRFGGCGADLAVAAVAAADRLDLRFELAGGGRWEGGDWLSPRLKASLDIAWDAGAGRWALGAACGLAEADSWSAWRAKCAGAWARGWAGELSLSLRY